MQGLLKQQSQAPQDEDAMAQQAAQQAAAQMQQQGGEAPVSDPMAQPGMEEGEGADENDPAFKAAVDYVRTVLYADGAADEINKAMTNMQSPAESIADMAYEITTIADEKTQGEVPDELLMLLASTVLSEIYDIAEASGLKVEPADMASSLKMMILRFVGEQGHDTQQLHQAMNQVSPEQINQMAAEGQSDELS